MITSGYFHRDTEPLTGRRAGLEFRPTSRLHSIEEGREPTGVSHRPGSSNRSQLRTARSADAHSSSITSPEAPLSGRVQ